MEHTESQVPEQPAKYQLRRMVLVNAGTNMHVPSGRITAIDPRGGAAVLGENGVGKTTTLRILPLFFGHLPSQIVAAGHGQEAMVRFVLPTEASAIAFEYQRGSDREDDIRLAVIRRRSDDPDVPFYRLYRCGFRRELFVAEGCFLSDEETQRKATELGITTTSKLTTAEYRAVILRAPATSKERERLRRYSLEWSFGPKSLDNLDRIVAAMVKKHINFNDIVQVAVGLVQQSLGHGSDRAKVSFKQGRGDIERWLRNRDACVDARKQESNIAALEDDLRSHREAEARLRSKRADVDALTVARRAESTSLTTELGEMERSRSGQLQEEAAKRSELAAAATSARQHASAAKAAHADLQAEQSHFDVQGAAEWELRLQELPGLRMTLQTRVQQLELAQSAYGQVTERYAQLRRDAETRTSSEQLVLEQGKEPHRERHQGALQQIGQAEAAALAEAETAAKERRQRLEDELEPLVQQRGEWEHRQRHPAASEQAQQDADDTARRLQAHTEKVSAAGNEVAQAEIAKMTSAAAFHGQEEQVRQARTAVESAAARAADARARLHPADGTLLAALRASSDDSWKRSLAKIVDLRLLGRTDLDPAHVEDAGQTAYGWRLNVGAIAAPDWADDAQAREAVAVAEEHLGSAQAHLEHEGAELAARSALLSRTEEALKHSQARLSVLDAQTQALKTAREAAAHRVDVERRSAKGQADEALARLKGQTAGIKKQRQDQEREWGTQRATISATHQAQRAEATQQRDQALRSIDESIHRLAVQLKDALADIDRQFEEHLNKAGVDGKRLAAQQEEVSRLKRDIETREAKEPLVARWQTWMKSGGPARVSALNADAQRAAQAAEAKAMELEAHDKAAKNAATVYENELGTKRKRLSDVEDEVGVLQDLDEEFGDYLAIGVSVIDPKKTTARELRGRVQDDRSKLSKLEMDISRRTSAIRQALTARDSAVKELIEASLSGLAEPNYITRAAELCICFKQIGPQVVTDVNNTLRTLLSHIGAFQADIQNFERGVAEFNRRLQSGLNEVKCFERVKDLRLDLVTNFDDLGQYKKLARLEGIVRQHKTEVGVNYTRDLPSDETARSLGEFASILGADGGLEVNLFAGITLRGEVTDNGQRKPFRRSSELENISSEGLTSLVLITLMTALLNTVRGTEPVHVPWVTDEVGRFDPRNFRALMQRLHENRIDVVTASPELGPAQQAMFAQRYLFEDRGRIREYRPLGGVADLSSGGGTSREEVVA